MGKSRILELACTGADEYLQAVGGDPFGGSSSMGLRVPFLATPDKTHRYLFLACSFSFGVGEVVRILGYRQFSSLGFLLSPTRFIEQEITSPNFRLPDGNISWHLQRIGGPDARGYPNNRPTPRDLNSFKKGWSTGSMLLYSDYTIPVGNRIYPQLTSYTPPMDGKPWGTPLSTGYQGTLYDQRTPWRDANAWGSLDMRLEGPDTVAFFISVRQSTGFYEVASTPPNGIPEEQFIADFGGGDFARPIYWRVGGSLIVEVSK